MEEYLAECENLMIKGDLQEAKEHLIAYYLAGLKFEIYKIVQFSHISPFKIG